MMQQYIRDSGHSISRDKIITNTFLKKVRFGVPFFGENKVARFLKIVYYDLQPCEKIKLNIGDAMKEYVNTFMRYRFLLGELVKKGIKLKYRRSYLGIIWSLLEPLLTMIVLTIVFGVWKQGSDISCIYPDRTSFVHILFQCHKSGIEISKSEFGNDQESLCAKISLSAVKCTF